MLIDCSCGQTNRVSGLSAKRMRCGKCQHVFTPQEMLKTRVEPAPLKPPLFGGTELDEMMNSIGETLGGLGADRVEWDGGFGFDIPRRKKGGAD